MERKGPDVSDVYGGHVHTFLGAKNSPRLELRAAIGLPVFAAGALGSAAHKAWLLHFQPFIADLELLLRAHHTFKQQQRQQTGESVTEQEALERGTGMQHTAADTGDAALMSENANVDAWADSAPDVLQFLAAELRGFVEGAGNLTAVQQLLQRLVLPS
eukprot:1152588-Pelagomonas_calceolata.AAC.13